MTCLELNWSGKCWSSDKPILMFEKMDDGPILLNGTPVDDASPASTDDAIYLSFHTSAGR
jgi:hypothetical protein